MTAKRHSSGTSPISTFRHADRSLEDQALQYFLSELQVSIDEPVAAIEPVIPLLHFVQQAWPIIEPRQRYVSNWHIEAIADHLAAVTSGELTDLLINVPPGCMKSILMSVMWPAWEWTQRPELRYLCASYDEALSVRDNLRMRTIIESAWFQQHWPVRLRRDQNMKTRFDNEQTGWRIATSVGGRGTGEHPHRKIIDDPHNVKRSLSKAQRQEAITWFDLTMGSRGLALSAATIVIMQRLHEDDLSGHILNMLRDRFTYICLPMYYEPPAMVMMEGHQTQVPRMPPTPLGWTDPRQTARDLLWPTLFDALKVEKLEAQLRAGHGEFGIAGQLQQRPSPETGGHFKRAWFPFVEARPAGLVKRVRRWDCAATSGGGDWTVGVLMAMTGSELIYVEDVVRGQWGPHEFEGHDGILFQTSQLDGREVAIREEQEPGSAGKKVIEAHVKLLKGYDYAGRLSTGPKEVRVRPFAAQAAVGNVRLVIGGWNRVYLEELCAFPGGAHDDQVDATAGAFEDLSVLRAPGDYGFTI